MKFILKFILFFLGLAQRLSHISLREQLKTDMTALMALCEKSQNDIRSCLSTLQFFKSRGLKLTSYDVHKTFVGSKDQTKGHFSVWQELFQMPRPTKRYATLSKKKNHFEFISYTFLILMHWN